MSQLVVLKFGGKSLAEPRLLHNLVKFVIKKINKQQKVLIVVSAMGQMTQHLQSLAKSVHPSPPKREMDMLVTAGERISMSLMAMALDAEGIEAVSFTGSQAGIITSSDHTKAEILEIRAGRLEQCLQAGKVAIVAGFQGVSREKEVTTLGLNGSDITAVALGVHFKATHIEFYKEVDGVYDRDPTRFSQAKHFPYLTFDQALQIVDPNEGVIHIEALKRASRARIPIKIVSYLSEKKRSTWIDENNQIKILLLRTYG